MLWAKQKTTELPDVILKTERLILRPPCREDWPVWSTVRSKNGHHLKPFEPTWPENCLTEDFFERRLLRQIHDWKIDKGQSFLMFKQSHHDLIGGMNINNICRGAAQYASLGYWIDEDHEGQGYMQETIERTLTYCFADLGLHRVHASCIPHNIRSKNTLVRCGFTEEGFAKNYLKINGQWQDHILFGICVEEHDA